MIEDTVGYKEMMRMNFGDFCEILRNIEPFITPQELLGGAKVVFAFSCLHYRHQELISAPVCPRRLIAFASGLSRLLRFAFCNLSSQLRT